MDRVCPICGKSEASAFRPFCSRRCADVDLGRWFSETYRAPAAEREGAEDEREGGDSEKGAARDGD